MVSQNVHSAKNAVWDGQEKSSMATNMTLLPPPALRGSPKGSYDVDEDKDNDECYYKPYYVLHFCPPLSGYSLIPGRRHTTRETLPYLRRRLEANLTALIRTYNTNPSNKGAWFPVGIPPVLGLELHLEGFFALLVWE